jgi:hypothetical protein
MTNLTFCSLIKDYNWHDHIWFDIYLCGMNYIVSYTAIMLDIVHCLRNISYTWYSRTYIFFGL